MKGLIFLVIAVLPFYSGAQSTFTEADLVAVVKKYHPVAKGALLDVRIANANLRASRGGFDPVASLNTGRKDFDGITYYDQQQVELKIPTWYGIDAYVGKETIEGSKVNPQETTGTINYLGVSVPLLQNVVIDKRRAAVQSARVLRDASEVARRAALNELIAEAVMAYWDWWEQSRALSIVTAALNTAVQRSSMVKTAYLLGDRPAIDTLEAVTQVQQFEQYQSEALMQLQKSRLQLSLYLWKEGDVAYELPSNVVPQAPSLREPPPLDSLLTAASIQPRLIEYDYKLRELNIERRLKFQGLLPELTAKYNTIGRAFSKTLNPAFFDNNYRFGIGFSLPLRLSEGRGEYAAVRFKIEQTRLAQAGKQVAVLNKVKQYYVEWQQVAVQYRQQQALVRAYQALQRAEEVKFANGESSLFLINARAAKTIEGERKEVALVAKLQQASTGLLEAAGYFATTD